jgi:anti-anti-sigma factor
MERLGAESNTQMRCDIATDDHQVTVMTVSGELDVSNVERLEQAALPIVDSRPERLVVDVSELRFADSSAIALWVRWAAAVGTLELRNPSPLLRRVVASMGLDRTFELT